MSDDQIVKDNIRRQTLKILFLFSSRSCSSSLPRRVSGAKDDISCSITFTLTGQQREAVPRTSSQHLIRYTSRLAGTFRQGRQEEAHQAHILWSADLCLGEDVRADQVPGRARESQARIRSGDDRISSEGNTKDHVTMRG